MVRSSARPHDRRRCISIFLVLPQDSADEVESREDHASDEGGQLEHRVLSSIAGDEVGGIEGRRTASRHPASTVIAVVRAMNVDPLAGCSLAVLAYAWIDTGGMGYELASLPTGFPTAAARSSTTRPSETSRCAVTATVLPPLTLGTHPRRSCAVRSAASTTN